MGHQKSRPNIGDTDRMKLRIVVQIIFSWMMRGPDIKVLRVYSPKPKYTPPTIKRRFEMQFKGFRRALGG